MTKQTWNVAGWWAIVYAAVAIPTVVLYQWFGHFVWRLSERVSQAWNQARCFTAVLAFAV